MQLIPLTQLEPHPDNANRMPEALLNKLIAHIRNTGEYPALIVREQFEQSVRRPGSPSGAREYEDSQYKESPCQEDSPNPRYQILDGHHRALALRRLRRQHAKCDVWSVDDAQAAMLLLTLNRLHGEDDPQRRGALLERLCQSGPGGTGMTLKQLAALLPDDADRIRKLIDCNKPPPPGTASIDAIANLQQAVTFFLSAAQRNLLFEQLACICPNRSQALVRLLGLQESAAHTRTQAGHTTK